jgi:hypothetical protein
VLNPAYNPKAIPIDATTPEIFIAVGPTPIAIRSRFAGLSVFWKYGLIM